MSSSLHSLLLNTAHLQPESLPSLPLFIEMCMYGLTPTDSQEGQIVRDQDEQIVSTERAYLSGFIRSDLAYRFLYYINQSDMIAFVPTDTTESTESSMHNIIVTYHEGHSRNVSTKPKIEEVVTSIPINNCEEFDESYPANKTDFVFVECVDAKHGRMGREENGLFQVILGILRKLTTL